MDNKGEGVTKALDVHDKIDNKENVRATVGDEETIVNRMFLTR
jgi:hypothetical protein